MAWSGSLTANSAVGSSITFTPDNAESASPASNYVDAQTYAGNYSVSSFKAPRRGVYRFVLRGSGGVSITTDGEESGAYGSGAGGTGGTTTGYLLLEANQTVYVGAGGVCRAAFVSSVNGASLAAIDRANLYFVAGAGGSGGAYRDSHNYTGYNCQHNPGGNGGGASGTKSTGNNAEYNGNPGTQSAGGAALTPDGDPDSAAGAYGLGGDGGGEGRERYGAMGGRGGDGYYGGSGGTGYTIGSTPNHTGVVTGGGAGGSGYVRTASLKVGSNTYTSTTAQGGGAAANGAGSVVVTYYANTELPVYFNGTQLREIYFNGERLQGLIYGGTTIFMRGCRKGLASLAGWLRRCCAPLRPAHL